jgi:hypothetical protein
VTSVDASAKQVSYILPIRRDSAAHVDELTTYLRTVAGWAQLIVIDASPPGVFAHHAELWSSFVAVHQPVAEHARRQNGKVSGVLTGFAFAEHEAIIIADDDVRWKEADAIEIARALGAAHIVRPQNYFDPLPWHARWDTGRMLINRALEGDWPGTLAVRRSAVLATGGYDGNVLFENFELVRTVVAGGGVERVARAVLVRRLPPTTQHFFNQRVRQAYDEIARPGRLIIQLALVPLFAWLLAMHALTSVATLLVMTILIAAYGRQRDGGPRVFRWTAPLWAPAWIAERAVCIWIALGYRAFRGGVPYAGRILGQAATPMRELRARYAGSITSTSIGLNEPLLDSSAEQAVTPTTRSISARTEK